MAGIESLFVGSFRSGRGGHVGAQDGGFFNNIWSNLTDWNQKKKQPVSRRRTTAGGGATQEQLGDNYSTAYRGGGRNNPVRQRSGPTQPQAPGPRRDLSTPLGGAWTTPVPSTVPNQADAILANQALQESEGGVLGPRNADPLPAIDRTPPPRFSDEDLLSVNSSQAQEATESEVLRQRQAQQDAAVPRPGSTGLGAPPQPGQGPQRPQPRIPSTVEQIAKHEGYRDEAYQDSAGVWTIGCLLYTSPSPRDRTRSRMPSSA